MSCEENRGRYLAIIHGPDPAGLEAAAALEHIFQRERGGPASALEAADNEAKTRLLFAQWARCDPPLDDPPLGLPTHSARGLPRRDAQRGYAQLYDHLVTRAAQGAIARCPLCGQFGPLGAHICPATCVGAGTPLLPNGAETPTEWRAAAARRDVLAARLPALAAEADPAARRAAPERWVGTAKAGEGGPFGWGWNLAIGHDDWSEERLWSWLCGLDREPLALRPAFERGVRAYRAADPAARAAVYAAGYRDLVGEWRTAQAAWATVAEQAALDRVAALATEAPAVAAAELRALAQEPGEQVRRAVAEVVGGHDPAFAVIRATLAADADPGVQQRLALTAARQRVAARRAARQVEQRRIREEAGDVV